MRSVSVLYFAMLSQVAIAQDAAQVLRLQSPFKTSFYDGNGSSPHSDARLQNDTRRFMAQVMKEGGPSLKVVGVADDYRSIVVEVPTADAARLRQGAFKGYRPDHLASIPAADTSHALVPRADRDAYFHVEFDSAVESSVPAAQRPAFTWDQGVALRNRLPKQAIIASVQSHPQDGALWVIRAPESQMGEVTRALEPNLKLFSIESKPDLLWSSAGLKAGQQMLKVESQGFASNRVMAFTADQTGAEVAALGDDFLAFRGTPSQLEALTKELNRKYPGAKVLPPIKRNLTAPICDAALKAIVGG